MIPRATAVCSDKPVFKSNYPTFAQKEAPILMVLRENSGLFSKTEEATVNYRLQKDRYVVDAVFDKAILITGVGGNQDRITITRGE